MYGCVFSHLISSLLKFPDEMVQFSNEQAIEQSRLTYVDRDILDMADCGGVVNQDFYDFNRVKKWHVSAAKSYGIASIFDLKKIFLSITKNRSHWLFTMVDMVSESTLDSRTRRYIYI